jgi:hypothetical protein
MDEARKIIAANKDKDFFSIKCLFPIESGQLGGWGFPSGKIRCNEAQNVVMFMKPMTVRTNSESGAS